MFIKQERKSSKKINKQNSRWFPGFESGLRLREQSVIRRLGARPCFRLPGPLGPAQPKLRLAYSPVLLAVFLQSFLCHGLHKCRVVPGDLWDCHGNGVGIKELQDHLREASGNAGVRTVGSHLEGGEGRQGLKHWPDWIHFATKVRLKSGELGPFAFY